MNLARKIVAKFLATKHATINDAKTLGQLIEDQVSSMTDELPHEDQKAALSRVKVTPVVKEKAIAWDSAVEHSLTEWCEKHMDSLRLGESVLNRALTADDVVRVMMELRGGAGYLYYMEHEGSGTGTWEGDWDVLFKTPRTTLKILSQHVLGTTHSQYKSLQEAVFDAALDTMPEGTEKQAKLASRLETYVADVSILTLPERNRLVIRVKMPHGEHLDATPKEAIRHLEGILEWMYGEAKLEMARTQSDHRVSSKKDG